MISTDILVVGGVLVAACLWMAWRMRALTRRLRQLDTTLATTATELESTRLQLQRVSTEDSLTALANHEQFLAFVEREWRRARRDAMPIALIFLDVDHFRSFNRQYGRRAGDNCLRQISRALESVVCRAGDLVARYHRDEFAVALAATDEAGAIRIAQRVREAIEQLQIPAANDAPSTVVTASVAAACGIPTRESTWEELDLIKAARQAMREARSAGGNRVSAVLTARVPEPPTIRLH
jgi:diguanylate cyclase (GGDEF)-like protein